MIIIIIIMTMFSFDDDDDDHHYFDLKKSCYRLVFTAKRKTKQKHLWKNIIDYYRMFFSSLTLANNNNNNVSLEKKTIFVFKKC